MRSPIRARAAVGLAVLCGWSSLLGAAKAQEGRAARGAETLRLQGVVIVLDRPERSTCLISRGTGTGKAVPFGLGDRLFGKASLVDVQIDHVLVKDAQTGRLERIFLEPPSASFRENPSRPITAEASPTGAPAPEVLVEIPREQADYFRGHLPEFLGSARSSLRFDERGAMTGFLIRDVEPAGPVGRLGIRDGDVVLGVNGVRLDGMAKLLALYPSLASLASVDIMLLRSGRLLTVGYRVK